MPVKVITDSASNMYKELLEEYDIDMVTMNFIKNDVLYPCYNPEKSYDEQGKEFYDDLRNGVRIKTSLATPADYYDCFKKYLEQGYDIFYTSISSKLSGTLNSAMNVKAQLEEEFPDRKIACIDSMSASFGEAMIAIRASELAKQGKSLDEIVEEVSSIRMTVRNEFTVGDLRYLKIGGRIQSIVFAIGSFLDIKLLLRASTEATIELCGKTRGRKKALSELTKTIVESIEHPEDQTVYIAHCDCYDDAVKVKEGILEVVPNIKKIIISMYDFCTGAHVGPGAIAVFYYGKERPKKQ